MGGDKTSHFVLFVLEVEFVRHYNIAPVEDITRADVEYVHAPTMTPAHMPSSRRTPAGVKNERGLGSDKRGNGRQLLWSGLCNPSGRLRPPVHRSDMLISRDLGHAPHILVPNHIW